MTSCLFCRIVAGEIPSDKVYEDEHVLAFRDIKPEAPVHILVIPKQHVESLARLTEQHASWLVHFMLTVGEVARRQGLEQNGYRVVTNHGADAGQTVDHLHLHILGGRELRWPPG